MPIPSFSPDRIDGNAYLGFNDVTNDAGVTYSASTAGTATPAAMAFDYLTYDWWSPSSFSAGVQANLQATFTTAKPVSFAGVAAHTLGNSDVLATVLVQYSYDNVTWTTVGSKTYQSGDNSPLMVMFPAVSALYWRLAITPVGAGTYRVGVFMLGTALRLQRGIYRGLALPRTARKYEPVTNLSESGQFLGRTLIRTTYRTSFQLTDVREQWVRDQWLPFQLWAEKKPFFFLWNYKQWPSEAMFAWATNQPEPQNDKPGFMTVDLEMEGFA